LAENPEAPPTASPAPSVLRRLLSLLPVLGIFAALAGLAFAAVLFIVRPLFPPMDEPTAKGQAGPERIGRILSLDSVVVNVAQTDGRRYLKTTIQLEVPEDGKAAKDVEARKAQLLDLLIAVLSRKSLADLTSPEALDRLRSELYERLVQELGKERLRRVFITEFVVQ
jgi:flagellar FliL protein